MDIFKKVSLINVVAITVFATTSLASTGTVTASALKLRKEPNTSADVITSIYEDSSVEILEENGEWFKVKYDGETGYVASNPTQMARIFKTWIVQTEEFSNGFPVCELRAYAYMIRTSENADVIKEIETGIRKEVSISCSVVSKLKVNKTTLLDGVTDVYEWSFVEHPMLADNKVRYSNDDYEKESNWFSIEDKAPNSGTFVLAICDTVDVNAPKGRKLTLKAVYKTKENDYVDERNCLQRVIKWMPLPDGTPPLWLGTVVGTGEKIT